MTKNNYLIFILSFVILSLIIIDFSILNLSTHYGRAQLSLNSSTICNGNGTCITQTCVDDKPCVTSNSTTGAKDKNNSGENETPITPTLPEEIV